MSWVTKSRRVLPESERRGPEARIYVQVRRRGRAWVERIDLSSQTAEVRYDPGEGVRSPIARVPFREIEWGFEDWDGWKDTLPVAEEVGR